MFGRGAGPSYVGTAENRVTPYHWGSSPTIFAGLGAAGTSEALNPEP